MTSDTVFSALADACQWVSATFGQAGNIFLFGVLCILPLALFALLAVRFCTDKTTREQERSIAEAYANLRPGDSSATDSNGNRWFFPRGYV